MPLLISNKLVKYIFSEETHRPYLGSRNVGLLSCRANVRSIRYSPDPHILLEIKRPVTSHGL